MLLKSWSIDAATSLDIALILHLLGREVLATREIAGSAGLFRLHPNHRPKSPILKRRGTGNGELTHNIRNHPERRPDWRATSVNRDWPRIPQIADDRAEVEDSDLAVPVEVHRRVKQRIG